MSAETLITENIDIWTSAVQAKSSSGRGSGKKRELYGIKKLRELILELAVRGKLVPQDPSDEPASVLLERIHQERIDGKKLKAAKPISEAEEPFHLPENWAFTRLESIIQISSGKNLTAKKMDADGCIPVFGGNGITGYHSEHNVTEPTIVIGRVGFYCGSIHLTPAKAWVTDNAFITYFSSSNLKLEFLVWLLKATNLSENDSATAQPVISGKKVYPLVVALPPLAEQHRIVAKVDELMELCDQLEQQTEASLDAHQVLVETLLATLTNSQNATELMANWARISEHFDTLFPLGIKGEQSIDALKQTILQLAVMGKLVAQDPNDEPAVKLLERIAEEKAQLVKEKKIKKQKALPPIAEDEKPFELPKGWEWTRLGNYSYVFAGNAFKSGDFNNDAGTRVIKITNAGVYSFIETNDFLPFEFSETYSQYQVLAGDLILALTRPYISSGLKVSVCPSNYNESLLNQRVAAIRALDATGFTFLFLRSPFVLSHYQKRFGGSGLQPNLKMSDVTDLFIAVPPKSEQKNIVRKVNELLAICDQLKQRLRDSQQAQLQLTDAIVEQAL